MTLFMDKVFCKFLVSSRAGAFFYSNVDEILEDLTDIQHFLKQLRHIIPLHTYIKPCVVGSCVAVRTIFLRV